MSQKGSSDEAQYQGASFDFNQFREAGQQRHQQPNQGNPQFQQQQGNVQGGTPTLPQDSGPESWSHGRLVSTVKDFASKLQQMQLQQRKLLYAYRLNRDYFLDKQKQAEASSRFEQCEDEEQLKSAYDELTVGLTRTEEFDAGKAREDAEMESMAVQDLVRSLYQERGGDQPPPSPRLGPEQNRVHEVGSHIEQLSDAYKGQNASGSVDAALRILAEIVLVSYAAAYEQGIPLEQGVQSAYQAALRAPAEDADGAAFDWTDGVRDMDALSVIREHGFNFQSFDQYADELSNVLIESDLDRVEAIKAASKVIGTDAARSAYESEVMPKTFLEDQGIL
jgi:hypothetical protein